MKKLNIFIVRSFLGPFIATFFIAIFLLLMQFLWKWVDDLVGKGLEISEITELLFFASVRFVPLALPISLLLASVMTFGGLAERSELIAIKAAGISTKQVMSPLIIFICLIGLGSFLFSNYVMPIANLRSASLLYSIQKQKPALNIKEGVFYNGIEGYSIKVEEKENDGKTLKNILIYNHKSGNGNDNLLIAKSGSMQLTRNEEILEFRLYDGYSYVKEQKKKRKRKKGYKRIKFKEDIIFLDVSSFDFKRTNKALYKGHYAMLNNIQLNNAIDSLKNKLLTKKQLIKENIINQYDFDVKPKESNNFQSMMLDENKKHKQQIYHKAIDKIRSLKSITSANKSDLEYKKYIIVKHKIEWHRKISLAMACFILFLIGAPLGTIIKKGGFGMPVMSSILFFVLYHVINIVGEKAAKEGSLAPIEGMWLANIIFLPIALFLIYNTSKENTSIDLNKYTNSFTKIFVKQ